MALNGWIKEIHERYADNEEHETFVSECDDYYGCLKAIGQNCKDAAEMYVMIDTFFVDSDEISDTDDSVVLSSGHRAKGLEWDRVVILRNDLMPHPGAKREADRKQEEHLKYVLLTRAKKELIISCDKEPC